MEKFLASVKRWWGWPRNKETIGSELLWHPVITMSMVLLVMAVLAQCGCVLVQEYEPHPLEYEPIDILPQKVPEYIDV